MSQIPRCHGLPHELRTPARAARGRCCTPAPQQRRGSDAADSAAFGGRGHRTVPAARLAARHPLGPGGTRKALPLSATGALATCSRRLRCRRAAARSHRSRPRQRRDPSSCTAPHTARLPRVVATGLSHSRSLLPAPAAAHTPYVLLASGLRVSPGVLAPEHTRSAGALTRGQADATRQKERRGVQYINIARGRDSWECWAVETRGEPESY